MSRRYASIFVALLGCIAWMVGLWFSFDPDNYFHYSSDDKLKWVYPWQHFLLTSFFLLIEVLLAYLVFRVTRYALWINAIAALTILLPWTYYVLPSAMHSPLYWYVWIISLLALDVIIMAAAVTSLLHHLFVRSHRS